MPANPGDPGTDVARIAHEADLWVARMHDADSARYVREFALWFEADPAHAQAYRTRERVYQSESISRAGNAYGAVPLTRIWYANPKVLAPLAALLLALLATGWFAMARAPVAPQELVSLSAPDSAVRQIALDDGSLLTLDRGARVTIAFSPGRRQLALLAGRARFEVAHDARRPFVVAAGGGEVTALGTIFEIVVAPSGTDIRLLRGAISVSAPADRKSGAAAQPARLSAGQGISLNPAAQLSPVGEFTEKPEWIRGLIAYDHVRLAHIVEEANLLGNPKIVLAEPKLAGLSLTGTLATGNNLRLAEQLAATFSLTLIRSSDGGIILSRK